MVLEVFLAGVLQVVPPDSFSASLRLLKARLKVLLKVLIRLLKARLKVLLKALIRLLKMNLRYF